MSLRATMVPGDTIQIIDGSVEVGVQLPWFRSLPLSCVEDITIALDGEELPGEGMQFRIGSNEWPLPDLKRVDREWFILDTATVVAGSDISLAPGATVELSVEIAIRIPDIIIGPGMAFTSRQRIAKTASVES